MLAEEWRLLREAALAANRAKFKAADLDGLMVGEAFQELVIKDPKVQAAGAWLYLERPVFREVFTEGMFPNRSQMHRMQHRPRRTNLPVRANVGYAELKGALGLAA